MAVTVNDDSYRAMLNEFSFTKIEMEDIWNIYFQQNGATCHASEADIVWPPRSCGFTPLDKCNSVKPDVIKALKDDIREAIGEI